jgi:hypothetical protein
MVNRGLIDYNYLCSTPGEFAEDFLFKRGKGLIEEYKNGGRIKHSTASLFLKEVSAAYESFQF